ncbi:stage II sporulation protein M [Lactobacillaceae bacterium L1_55_11]|nr:stage II sporulation protein M [Lactobacillaceae bacterium L1_55_11]
MKVRWQRVLAWQLIDLVLLAGLVAGLYWLLFAHATVPGTPAPVGHGWPRIWEIFWHNLLVMLVNLVLFVISPLLIIWNWMGQALALGLNVRLVGWSATWQALWPHGIFEIPAIFLFQYLSVKMLRVLVKTRSWLMVGRFVRVNWVWYLVSVGLLAVAAVIEGW